MFRRLLLDDERKNLDRDSAFELGEDELDQLEEVDAVFFCRHHKEMLAGFTQRGDIDLAYHATHGDRDLIITLLTEYRAGRTYQLPIDQSTPKRGGGMFPGPPPDIHAN